MPPKNDCAHLLKIAPTSLDFKQINFERSTKQQNQDMIFKIIQVLLNKYRTPNLTFVLLVSLK